MAKIFENVRLKASQLRTVAQRRYEDALCLRDTGENARANGVFYFGGFVIECLLKAMMLELFPSMQRAKSPEKLSAQDRKIWGLIYRSHDLEGILAYLPDLQRKLVEADRREGTRRYGRLKLICQAWTIFARYSPHTETMKRAAEFLGTIKELMAWLR